MTTEKNIIHDVDVISELLNDDGIFINNEQLPLLVYKGAVNLPKGEEPQTLEELFEKNHWSNSWRNGIYNYHHYHSTTHEVLGVYAGCAKIQMGGDNGIAIDVQKGDVIIIPAGVAHKNLGSSGDFACVGAYPDGADYDMNYGKPEERGKALQSISLLSLPFADPVFGKHGKLFQYWNKGKQ